MPGIYAIGIISIFVTARNQRLGDLAAGTVVVHEGVASGDAPQFTADAPEATASTQHGALKLTAEEISVIELFFRRRQQLDVFARERAARRIAERIRERLAITERIDDEQLIEEVGAEYKARGRYR